VQTTCFFKDDNPEAMNVNGQIAFYTTSLSNGWNRICIAQTVAFEGATEHLISFMGRYFHNQKLLLLICLSNLHILGFYFL